MIASLLGGMAARYSARRSSEPATAASEDDKRSRRFKSIAAALQGRSGDVTVLIHHNGPLEIEPLGRFKVADTYRRTCPNSTPADRDPA